MHKGKKQTPPVNGVLNLFIFKKITKVMHNWNWSLTIWNPKLEQG